MSRSRRDSGRRWIGRELVSVQPAAIVEWKDSTPWPISSAQREIMLVIRNANLEDRSLCGHITDSRARIQVPALGSARLSRDEQRWSEARAYGCYRQSESERSDA